MSRTKDRDDRDDREDARKLPVTAEVGTEGGSFAEATLQIAQFEGDVGVTAGATEPEKVTSDDSDVAKYPGEPSKPR